MTGYEMRKHWLTDTLETYRNTQLGAWKRAFIDGLMERSRRAVWGNEDKTLHNLAVLEYIAGERRAKSAICQALHIGRDNYGQTKQKAVERLCVLAFGVDGIGWGRG